MVDVSALNAPKLLGSFDRLTTVYIKVLNAGNVRLHSNKEDLQNSVSTGIAEGIPQVTGDGVKQYFWLGDLWWISDATGTQVVMVAPGYQFYQDRGKNMPQPNDGVAQVSEAEGNLSTQ